VGGDQAKIPPERLELAGVQEIEIPASEVDDPTQPLFRGLADASQDPAEHAGPLNVISNSTLRIAVPLLMRSICS
jgi:hypothetical protein